MNLLNIYAPSMDRIYGNNLPQLRSSFQTLLIVLEGVGELFPICEPDEREAKLNMLIGCTNRHFELQAQLMAQAKYEPMDTHIDKHCGFIQTVEMFCFNFPHSTFEQNRSAYRSLQKWLLHHLLMDDAHFMSKSFP